MASTRIEYFQLSDRDWGVEAGGGFHSHPGTRGRARAQPSTLEGPEETRPESGSSCMARRTGPHTRLGVGLRYRQEPQRAPCVWPELLEKPETGPAALGQAGFRTPVDSPGGTRRMGASGQRALGFGGGAQQRI